MERILGKKAPGMIHVGTVEPKPGQHYLHDRCLSKMIPQRFKIYLQTQLALDILVVITKKQTSFFVCGQVTF